jgi:pre-mRNA-processing factor 39
MGDSELMVTETSAAETYPSDGYNNTTASNPVPEAAAAAPAEVAGEAGVQDNSSYELGYSGDGNAYTAGDPNSVLQQAQFSATNESKQADGAPDANSGAVGNEATDSTMVSGEHLSVNGGVDTAGLENGNALEHVDGSADEKQLTDAYGIFMPFLSDLSCLYYYLEFCKKNQNSILWLGIEL